jgi:hypothetical protein
MSLLTRIIMEAERDSALQELARHGLLRVRTNRPAGPGEAGPVRVGGAGPTRAGSSKQVGSTSPTGVGTPISNNSAGRPDVHVIGRSPQPAKPIRSTKSQIVPEPDQIQSAPPRRSSPLEPPGS